MERPTPSHIGQSFHDIIIQYYTLIYGRTGSLGEQCEGHCGEDSWEPGAP